MSEASEMVLRIHPMAICQRNVFEGGWIVLSTWHTQGKIIGEGDTYAAAWDDAASREFAQVLTK